MRFWVLTALCLCLCGPAHAAALRVAVDGTYPPMAYTDESGRLAGFDVDIARALCAEMKAECDIRHVVFEDIVPGVADGAYDMAVAGLGVTPEREAVVAFTDKYYRSHTVFVERAGAPSLRDVVDLRGKKVGAQAGTMQEDYLRTHFTGKADILTRKNFEEVFEDLRQGRVDMIMVDGLPAYAFLKTSEGAGLEVVGEPVHSDSLAAPSHIIVSKARPQLRESVNAAIQAIRRNGEYARINRKYFDFSVY